MSRRKRQKKSFNIWKYICLTFFALIVGLYIYVAFFVSADSTSISQASREQAGEVAHIKMEATRENAEHFIDQYLAQMNQDENFHYDINLQEDGLYVAGNVSYLGMTYPFEMQTTPEVLDNGNIQLNIESITVSNFELPRELILTILSTRDTFPDFIAINAEANYIGVNLTELTLDNGVSFGAEVIDLPADQLELSVYLPKDGLQ
ncbi:YpmS family protein [Dolosigranulum savutiense]|uniref:YpmS family protein n=1 Tax=Dolosigranulum savutiense TaxID=3110288 RepID=A0AB74U3E9_9LACT